MDFFGFLLSLLALTIIFQEPTETPDELNTFVPAYEYADPEYESDFSFSPDPCASLSEDNAHLPALIEDIPSEYGEYYVTDEHIHLDTTETVPAEVEVVHEEDDEFTFTTEQIQIGATPTSQVDMNATVANDTSVTQIENIPVGTTIILTNFVTVILIIIIAALFIATMCIMWNNYFESFPIKYNIFYKTQSKDTDLVSVTYDDADTI